MTALLPGHPGTRAVVDVAVTRVSDACGYGVPVMEMTAERDLLLRHAEKEGRDGPAAHRRTKDATSIDGLPGL